MGIRDHPGTANVCEPATTIDRYRARSRGGWRPIGATNPADWLPPSRITCCSGSCAVRRSSTGFPHPCASTGARGGWCRTARPARNCSSACLPAVRAGGSCGSVEPSPAPDGDGCPTGVAYETRVYEHILAPGGHGPPRFLGGSHNAATGEDWLFVEFLQGAVRLPGLPIDVAGSAASWLGLFHRSFERSPIMPASSFVRRYDEAWYRDRVDRALASVGAAGRESRDVDAIADSLRRDLAGLLEAPTTLIHGDFWTQNILIARDGHPTDRLGLCRDRARRGRSCHAHPRIRRRRRDGSGERYEPRAGQARSRRASRSDTRQHVRTRRFAACPSSLDGLLPPTGTWHV